MDVNRCPRCWKPMPASAAFCRRCGRALQAASRAQPATFVPPVTRAAQPPAHLPAQPPLQLPAQPPPLPGPAGGGWSSFVLATAITAVTAGAFLFGVAEPRDCATVSGPSAWEAQVRPDAATRDAAGELAATDDELAETAAALTRVAEAPITAPVAAPVAPRIDWVSSGRVSPFVPLVVRGEGLIRTQRVLFIGVSDGQRAEGRFDPRGDDLLYVKVPYLGPMPQDLVMVIVTPAGAAVAAGRDGTGRVAFVDGCHSATAAAGRTLFVRRGGIVRGRGNDDTCHVFREADVPFTARGGFRSETDVPVLNAHRLETPLRYAGR